MVHGDSLSLGLGRGFTQTIQKRTNINPFNKVACRRSSALIIPYHDEK
jgi:hypothetical protein